MTMPKSILSPEHITFTRYESAEQAYERLLFIYERNTKYIRDAFTLHLEGNLAENSHVRAFYPAIRIRELSHKDLDSRLSYGYLSEPGTYQTTITQPL